MTDGLSISPAKGDAFVTISNAAGSNQNICMATNRTPGWDFITDISPGRRANAGSNLIIRPYGDNARNRLYLHLHHRATPAVR